MTRILHDRYLRRGPDTVTDLVTGEAATLAELVAGDGVPDESPVADLIEVLEHGRDGSPRWVVAEARNAAQAGALGRRAAAAARRRGYVAISVDTWVRWRAQLEEELRDRALLIIGAPASPMPAIRAALVGAAEVSSRPHVLLTFHLDTARSAPGMVREARAAYGSPVPAPQRVAPLPDDVVKHLRRADHAGAFVRAGRHAAAERLLRDVSASLERRHAYGAAAEVALRLASVLLERGRAADGEAQCRDAIRIAERGDDSGACIRGRAWQGWARTDLGQLGHAESLLRAVAVTEGGEPGGVWTRVALARCLLAQGRCEDARAVMPAMTAVESLSATSAAMARALAVRLALAAGDQFEAGRQAREGLIAVAESPDSLAAVIAGGAHLRALCAAGDLVLAGAALARVIELARRHHAPLRATRARLVWFEALRRAGRASEATLQARRLSRVAPRCPPLLGRNIVTALREADTGGVAATVIVTAPDAASQTAELVRLVQRDEDDGVAMRTVLVRTAGWVSASRTEVVSSDSGAVSTVLAVGSGAPTACGARAIESGIAVGFDEPGHEAAVPVWIGSQQLGALVCRWPVDRAIPMQARTLMELAGAVLAPRLESFRSGVRDRAAASAAVPELIGESVAVEELRRAIARAARAPFSVLIEGESGTGKELVARAIHQLGARRDRPFCDVNCAAMPEELFESELFGHARGAFTGAVAERAGLFEDANGGTLFMDEVAELSARAQAKLLRVVQQQEVRRVGESFSRPVDIRLIAAANRDMRGEADAGRFRPDLLYRIDVIRIHVPPLRERPGDIPALAQRFWTSATERIGSKAVLTPGVFAELAHYRWPGNVRELQNVIAALAVAAPARGRVGAGLLPSGLGVSPGTSLLRLSEARDDFDRRFIEAAIVRAGGSRTRAAAALGLSRQGLLKLVARLRAGDESAPPTGTAPGAGHRPPRA